MTSRISVILYNTFLLGVGVLSLNCCLVITQSLSFFTLQFRFKSQNAYVWLFIASSLGFILSLCYVFYVHVFFSFIYICHFIGPSYCVMRWIKIILRDRPNRPHYGLGRPSVSPCTVCGFLIRKQEQRRKKTKFVRKFLRPGITGTPIFSSEGRRSISRAHQKPQEDDARLVSWPRPTLSRMLTTPINVNVNFHVKTKISKCSRCIARRYLCLFTYCIYCIPHCLQHFD